MLKQIKYFQSVVRLNSFSQAAEENYISQSAISQQVQALERELGFPLLERKNRSFTLTPAGEYFYQKSLILTADYERMCGEAAKIANGNRASLKIGYLRCYTGAEFHRTLALFSEKHPEVEVSIAYGNHEELYDLIRGGGADIVLNDQRRAFSDEYVNLVLTTCRSYIEVSSHSPLAQTECISPSDLKNTPCILVASEAQREIEQEYYRDVVGFRGEFLYAENLEEARLMVIGRKGFLPVEGANEAVIAGDSIVRIPLVRGEAPILRNYCAFWKKDNPNGYVEEFAQLLKAQFTK
ncbi:MAG: LysR family transcriptional regulator [Clostridia bacterium]|nr:LysR family transcriptional regulator [Clostridia bacterium]